MSYRLYRFEPLDGSGIVDLPFYNPTDDVSPPEPKYGWVNAYNGFYDYLGNSRARLNGQTITKSSTLHATSSSQLVTYYDELRALVGKKGKLYAKMHDDSIRWKYARFYVSGSVDNVTYNRCNLDLNMSFEVPDVSWKSETLVSTTTNITSTNQNIIVANDGNYPISNAVLTLTSPSSNPNSLTGLLIKITGISEFTWAGSLSPNSSLIIDTGARSIKIGSVDQYNNFTLTSNHTINEWLKLEPGNNTVNVQATPSAALPVDVGDLTGYATGGIIPLTYSEGSISGSNVTLTIEYYNQWV